MCKYGFFVLLLFCLFGCGASSSRLDSSGTPDVESGVSGFAEISGRVVKGVVRNAEVNLYLFDRLSPSDGEPIASGKTDLEGRYKLEVSERYLGLPVYLLVTVGGENAEMICDLAVQCRDLEFGASIPLDESFGLAAVSSALKRKSVINVTLLTDVAAKTVSGVDWRTQDGRELMQLQLEIAQANSRVASRFGVVGDIPGLAPVDLTNANEVSEADGRALWYSLINSGIWGAVVEINTTGQSVTDDISLFSGAYVLQGLPSHLDVDDVVTLTYESILEEARKTVVYLQENIDQTELSNVLVEFDTSLGLSRSVPSNFDDQGSASEVVFLTGYERALRLITDISQLTASINLPRLVSISDISSLLDPDTSGLLDDFGFELSAAEITDSKNTSSMIDALSQILNVVIETLTTYISGGEIPTSIGGVEFTHSVENLPNTFESEAVHKFGFFNDFDVCEQMVPNCIVEPHLEISIYTKGLLGNEIESFISATEFDISLEGVISAGNLSVTLSTDDQSISLTGLTLKDLSAESTSGAVGEELNIRLITEALTASVPFSLTSLGALDEDNLYLRATFELSSGQASLDFYDATELVTGVSDANTKSIFQVIVHHLENAKMALGLLLENQASNDGNDNGAKNIVLSMGLGQTKAHVGEKIIYTDFNDYWCPDLSDLYLSSCDIISENSGFTGETDDNFLSFALSAGFKANLSGLTTPVNLEVSGARDGPFSTTIDTMKLRYPGQAVALRGTFRGGNIKGKSYIESLEAVSLDGTQMSIESDSNDIRSGKIVNSVDDLIAEIVHSDEWLNVRFTNGNFQSFCRC